MPPRLTVGTFAARVFFLSFFSFLTVILGAVLLGTLDAVRETIEAFERPTAPQVFWFAVAEFYWALCAWYSARLVLERVFAPYDPLLPCTREKLACSIVRWVPRAVGLCATIPLAISIGWPRSAEFVWLRLLPFGVGVIFFVFVVVRRRVLGAFVEYLPADEPGYAYRRFTRINSRGRVFLAAAVAVPLLVFLLLTLAPRVGSRWLGTPAIVLFALGSWNLFGGLALIYWPLSKGRSVLTVYPLLIFLVFSTWMENHNTPVGAPPGRDGARAPDRRQTLEAQWGRWFQAFEASECAGGPVYLVAAAGGAARAAFWTADVLTYLEEQTRAAGQTSCFARSMFVISGVSGGSLGAATFVSLLAEERVRGGLLGNLRARAHDFHDEDMLAPVSGYLLFQDFAQRFLPVSVPGWDRSHGLEEAWMADWQEQQARHAAGAPAPPNWFALPMETLYENDRDLVLPTLFLNTTRVSNGHRALQSNTAFAPDEMHDLFQEDFLTKRLTLAGAVHNSARFMYVSPAARVWKLKDGEPAPWDYLVDGGYFENSGAATLAEVIKAIPDDVRPRLTLLLISSNPFKEQADYLCSPTQAPDTPAPSSLAIELVAPPFALEATRVSRAHAADLNAVRALGDRSWGRVFELRMPYVEGQQPPMTWFVSAGGAREMQGFVDTPHDPDGRLGKNLAALRQYAATKGAASSPCGDLYISQM
jgi:hypothetical protein